MNQRLQSHNKYHFATFARVSGYYPTDVPHESKPIYRNAEMLILEERDHQLWFEQWEPDPPGNEPISPRIRTHTFSIPRTLDQALDYAVQAGAWEATPEAWQDFHRTYELIGTRWSASGRLTWGG